MALRQLIVASPVKTAAANAKSVPTQAPAAPAARTAASPRGDAIPPAASTGTPTRSSTVVSNGSVPTAGLVDAGYYAVDSLRIEKGFRAWGRELTPDVNPYEAGLGFAVKLGKGDFLGREALVAAKAAPRTKRLIALVGPRQAPPTDLNSYKLRGFCSVWKFISLVYFNSLFYQDF